MKTFTYWKSQNLYLDCYSVRGKTKKEVLKELEEMKKSGDFDMTRYGPVKKVFIQYTDLANLIFDAKSEDGLYEYDVQIMKITKIRKGWYQTRINGKTYDIESPEQIGDGVSYWQIGDERGAIDHCGSFKECKEILKAMQAEFEPE